MIDFLENGSIRNSVNFPECIVEDKAPGTQRLCIANKNVEGVLGTLTAALAGVQVCIPSVSTLLTARCFIVPTGCIPA